MRTVLNRHESLVAEMLGEVTPRTREMLIRMQSTRSNIRNLTDNNVRLLKDSQPKIPTAFINKFSKALNANLFGEDATDLRAEVFTAGGAGEEFDGFVEIYKRGAVIATYKFSVTHNEEFQKKDIDTFYIPSRSFKKGETEFYVSPEIFTHMIEVAKNALKIPLREKGVEAMEEQERKRGKRHIVGTDHYVHRMV